MGKVLSETDYALLTYYNENSLLELTWKASCTFEEYQNIFNEAVKIAERNKTRVFLSDIRNQGAISFKNLTWLSNNIIPRATKLGVKKIAMVMNEELFANIYTDLIKKSTLQNHVEMNAFLQKSEALEWLID